MFVSWRPLATVFSHTASSIIPDDVDSLLVAKLKALLNAATFLTHADAAAIGEAAQRAVHAAAAAAKELTAVSSEEEWSGPNRIALSLLALVHVRRGRRAGIIKALDAVHEMVS